MRPSLKLWPLHLEATLFTIHLIGDWLKTYLSYTNTLKFGHCSFSTKTILLAIGIEAHLLTSEGAVPLLLFSLIEILCLHL